MASSGSSPAAANCECHRSVGSSSEVAFLDINVNGTHHVSSAGYDAIFVLDEAGIDSATLTALDTQPRTG